MRWWLVLCCLLLLTACGQPVRGPGSKGEYEVVNFQTEDGVNIVGHYYHSDSQKAVLMLHMLARHSDSFDKLAKDLQDEYAVLAIDLRGHGDSDGDFSTMVEADFRAMEYDVAAAMEALQELGYNSSSVSIIGASIGANLAVLYADDHNIDKLVLISPGELYRGIDITRVAYKKPMLVLVADYDAYAAISVDDLSLNWPKAKVIRYNAALHGNDLINRMQEPYDDLLAYMR